MPAIDHLFVSAKTDGADATVVRPSDWNAAHVGLEWYRTTADLTNSTVTPSNLTGLAFAIAASEVVNFILYINSFAAALTTGIAISATGPASPTAVSITMATGMSAGTAVNMLTPPGVAAFATRVIGLGHSSITLPQITIVHGAIQNGTTAGTVQLEFSSEIAASLVTVRRGALLLVYR